MAGPEIGRLLVVRAVIFSLLVMGLSAFLAPSLATAALCKPGDVAEFVRLGLSFRVADVSGDGRVIVGNTGQFMFRQCTENHHGPCAEEDDYQEIACG